MKKVYFLSRVSKGKTLWDWTTVAANGNILESSKQGYSNKEECKQVFNDNFNVYDEWTEEEMSRREFNAMRKAAGF